MNYKMAHTNRPDDLDVCLARGVHPGTVWVVTRVLQSCCFPEHVKPGTPVLKGLGEGLSSTLYVLDGSGNWLVGFEGVMGRPLQPGEKIILEGK